MLAAPDGASLYAKFGFERLSVVSRLLKALSQACFGQLNSLKIDGIHAESFSLVASHDSDFCITGGITSRNSRVT